MGLKTALIIVVLTIPFFALTVWAIVHALQREFGTIGKKALWCLVAAIPFVGAIVYFLFGARKGRKPYA
jgi:hypothetical protein